MDLTTATPHYARVRHPNGREATLSTKDFVEPVGMNHFPASDMALNHHLLQLNLLEEKFPTRNHLFGDEHSE